MPPRIARLRMTLRGVVDALRGRLGRYEPGTTLGSSDRAVVRHQR
jgi:hypothetical protein